MTAHAKPASTEPEAAPQGPLKGLRVIDAGTMIAGPLAATQLADFGAEVIKVELPGAGDSMRHWAPMKEGKSLWWKVIARNKRLVTLTLSKPRGQELFRELVKTADVVQHNMRYDAALRLGVDYESLKAIKPDLIYCHTRGHERGPREKLPGNDQTGAALAGPDWLDGGLDHDGIPLWPVVSLGDTGNGFLSAIGMVQALYHRDRTGEGQFVDTSIMYAQLLNASIAWSGTTNDTRRQSREQYGYRFVLMV